MQLTRQMRKPSSCLTGNVLEGASLPQLRMSPKARGSPGGASDGRVKGSEEADGEEVRAGLQGGRKASNRSV